MGKITRVTDDAHKKLTEMRAITERSIIWIASRAIDNYYKVTIGNRIAKKD